MKINNNENHVKKLSSFIKNIFPGFIILHAIIMELLISSDKQQIEVKSSIMLVNNL